MRWLDFRTLRAYKQSAGARFRRRRITANRMEQSMLRQVLTFACAGACTTLSHAGGTVSVDLLSPGDAGFEGIPSQLRCVDVFVDLAFNEHDAWTTGGIRLLSDDIGPGGNAGDARIAY